MSSVDKALEILLLLGSERQAVGVGEIGRRLHLSPPTVHRLLTTMSTYDLVQHAESGSDYRLGWANLNLSRSVLNGSELAQVAPGVARNLRDLTDETVTAQVRVGREQVVVVETEGTHELRRRVGIGRRMPLHAGASGRAILAFLPLPEIETYLTGRIEQIIPTTQTDPDVLAEQLRETRRVGYAVSRQESVAGVAAISVPVFGADGTVAGSLSVSGPEVRLGPEVESRVVPLVQSAGRTLSRAMGHRTDALRPEPVTA